MTGTSARVRELEAKVEKQAVEVSDLRRSVEALNVLVAERAPIVLDRSARISAL